MTCLFDPAIFDTAIFDSCGDVATVTPSGGYDDLRHALHFYDNHIPSRKRDVAQDIVDKAASVQRLADAAKKTSNSEYIVQMGLLRAEFLALTETKQARDEARRAFSDLIALESERQDAQAAFMAFIIAQL